MKIRALRSFAGPSISMGIGEIRNIKSDEAKRLIRAGHAEEVEKQSHDEKEVAENENKPGDAE